MKVTLKKAESFETCKPGEWTKDKQGRVYVMCPHEHGYPAMITGQVEPSKAWKIDAAGNVTPSIWIKNADCNWHVFATLEGWIP